MMTRKLLTFTLSMAMLFIAISANSQTQDAHEYYIDLVSGATDSVVTGANMPYYVEPDPILNNIGTAQYDTTQTPSANGVNTTFSWSSSIVTGGGTVSQSDPDGGTAPYNHFNFTGFTQGDEVTISVTETGPAPASCAGTPVEQTVIFLDQPSFTPDDGSGSYDLEICDGAVRNVLIASIPNQGIDAPGFSNFKFKVDVQKEVLDADGNSTGTVAWEHTDSLFTVETTQNVSDVILHENYYFNCYNDGSDDRITRYNFDFGSTVDGNTSDDGMNHHISRKSDYFSLTESGAAGTDLSRSPGDDYAWTYYAPNAGSADNDMISITVYPTPNTGDIYFVPNDFDLENN